MDPHLCSMSPIRHHYILLSMSISHLVRSKYGLCYPFNSHKHQLEINPMAKQWTTNRTCHTKCSTICFATHFPPYFDYYSESISLYLSGGHTNIKHTYWELLIVNVYFTLYFWLTVKHSFLEFDLFSHKYPKQSQLICKYWECHIFPSARPVLLMKLRFVCIWRWSQKRCQLVKFVFSP